MIPREAEFKDILKKLGRSNNTIKAYLSDLKLLFKDNTVITNESIQASVFAMTDKGKKPTSIRRFLSSVKTYCSIFNIDINFYTIYKPKIVVREASYIEDNIFAKGIGMILADNTLDKKDSVFRCAIFHLLYKTGIRVRELLALKVEDYNSKKGFIQIIGKGNKQRKIPIHNTISYIFELDWVFDKLGKVHYNTILYWTKKYFGDKYSPHSFRHGYTTKLVKSKASERAVQTVLGHESFVTTLRYFHMSYDEINNEVLSAMEDEND